MKSPLASAYLKQINDGLDEGLGKGKASSKSTAPFSLSLARG